MPYSLPTLADKRLRARTNLAARIPGADVTLRRSPLAVLADTTAQESYDEIQFMRWVLAQFFPDTADLEYLVRFASRYGIQQKGAAPAAGTAVFSGTASAAAPIPSGTLLQTSDGTATFQTTAAGAIGSSGLSAAIPILATTPGSVGNLDVGTQLNLIIGIAGVDASATVGTNGTTGGLDIESQADLLERVLQRLQNPPQGGAATDYVQWAEEVAGVTRAWSYPRNRGTGTIDVAFVFDARANIIPTAADVTAEQAYLDTVRPSVGDCQAFALTPDTIVVALSGVTFSSGVTQENGEAAIQQSLVALFGAATPGGNGEVVGPGVTAQTPAGLTELSQVNTAIGGTTGVVRYELVSPTADIQSAQGHLAVLGGVTFS